MVKNIALISAALVLASGPRGAPLAPAVPGAFRLPLQRRTGAKAVRHDVTHSP